jgi:hypothetical protein
MKRIRIIGLALVAVFAFSAVVAAAAQAGEYGRCAKVAKIEKKYHGKYEDKNCTEANPTIEGKYEWAPGPGPEPGYTSTTKVAILKSAAGNIVCKKSTDTGEITGVKSDVDTVTFTSCVLEATKGACTSAGEVAGTIKTNLLDTTLIDHGEKGLSGLEPAEGEAWTEYSVSSGYQAEFTCEPGILFRISGSLSGVTSPLNEMVKKLTTVFSATGGEQDLITEFSLDGGAEWTAVPSEEITEGSATFEEKSEIKA